MPYWPVVDGARLAGRYLIRLDTTVLEKEGPEAKSVMFWL